MLYCITMLKDPKNSHTATKADIHRLDQKIDSSQKVLSAKLDKLQNTLDGFVGVVDNLRIENEVGADQTAELREKAADHERRITSLESSRQSA